MIEMTLAEALPKVLLSPYVIVAAVLMFFYGSIISNVASGRERRRKAPPPLKPSRIPKLKKVEEVDKNEDTSEIELD